MLMTSTTFYVKDLNMHTTLQVCARPDTVCCKNGIAALHTPAAPSAG